MKNKLKAIGSIFAVLTLWMAGGCNQQTAPVAPPSQLTKAAWQSGSSPTVNMAQSCSSPSAGLNGTVTYTVHLDISGGACTNAQVQDVLPAGLSYVQGTATTLQGGTFACTGSTLTWVMSTVGPCSCTMSYVAQVNNLVGLLGTVLQNTAVMTCSELSAALSATANLAVSATGSLTPTLTIALPTATPTFTCVPPTATPTFTYTCVPPTATPTFTATNTHTPTNTATHSFTPTKTNTPTNSFTPTNTLSPTNTPTPLPTVNLIQTASSVTAALGGSVTYTVNLAVSGCAAANATIQDILPAGLTYVQGTATTLQGGAFTCAGQTLTWVMNSVGPCSCSMTYVAQVNNVLGLVGSTLGNTATMTCPWLSGSLSSTANLNITGLLGLGL